MAKNEAILLAQISCPAPDCRGETGDGRGEVAKVLSFVASVKILLHCPAVFDRKPSVAEVVELVDTLGSGSSDRTVMRVRVSPSAPSKKRKPVSNHGLFAFG